MAKRARFKIPDWPRDRPTVDKVKPLVDAIYNLPDGAAGHCLHVVLDDRNLKDVFILHSLNSPHYKLCSLCEKVARLMLQMSMTQRRRL